MSPGALSGIRVLEVGNFMAAPFCTLQLADLGADVIKVENPDGGDQTRASGPFVDGESSPFIRLNRNKRSLALDLKKAEGKEVFRRLVRRADVLVENLRPGTMTDLQLDWPRLSRENPRLRRGQSSCRSVMVPGRRFSTNTSARRTKRRKTSLPSAFLRSSASDRLFRFRRMNGDDSPSTKGPLARV